MLIISKSKEPENLPSDMEINYAIVRHVNFTEWQFVIKDIKQSMKFCYTRPPCYRVLHASAVNKKLK